MKSHVSVDFKCLHILHSSETGNSTEKCKNSVNYQAINCRCEYATTAKCISYRHYILQPPFRSANLPFLFLGVFLLVMKVIVDDPKDQKISYSQRLQIPECVWVLC